MGADPHLEEGGGRLVINNGGANSNLDLIDREQRRGGLANLPCKGVCNVVAELGPDDVGSDLHRRGWVLLVRHHRDSSQVQTGGISSDTMSK